MKIKILYLYAVAYSATLKHCPVGGGVAVINALIKDMCGALYYWCRLLLGCHQRTCHCLRQMSWQKVRHLLILHTRRRMQKRRRHDSKAPGQDRTAPNRTGLDRLEPHRPLDMLHTLLAETFLVFPHPFCPLSVRVSFFPLFCFATGNTSWTTKHKIVLSILCGLNKIKIIKTISFYVHSGYVCVWVCVCE